MENLYKIKPLAWKNKNKRWIAKSNLITFEISHLETGDYFLGYQAKEEWYSVGEFKKLVSAQNFAQRVLVELLQDILEEKE
jgi:hypothetical protein